MTTFLISIIVLALVFDYINGFHDAANSIATVVSTKVLTPFQAVLWAAIFNSVAYFIFKDHGVANTVAKTVNADAVNGGTMMNVIFAGLIAAIAWNLLTWWFGIPSSSSHTLIGGFAGAGIAAAGIDAVNTTVILKTASFIILAPMIGMLMAFIMSIWFLSSFGKGWKSRIISILVIAYVIYFLQSNLLTDPAKLAGKTDYESYLMQVIFYSKNFKWILLAFILLTMAFFALYLNKLNAHRSNLWFKKLQLVSSAAFSIGHGGNDAQKVMGIICAALLVYGNNARNEGREDTVRKQFAISEQLQIQYPNEEGKIENYKPELAIINNQKYFARSVSGKVSYISELISILTFSNQKSKKIIY